jgi:nucleoside-diphosphate-sugar epimerase
MNINGCHIINIANEAEWSITDLAQKIKEITNSKSDVIYLEAPKKRYDYEVERRVGSSDKLFKLTQYKPQTSLPEGLKLIYSKNYNN